jgi:hypothetical protein
MGATPESASPTTRNPQTTSSGSRVASARPIPPAVKTPCREQGLAVPKDRTAQAVPSLPAAIAA